MRGRAHFGLAALSSFAFAALNSSFPPTCSPLSTRARTSPAQNTAFPTALSVPLADLHDLSEKIEYAGEEVKDSPAEMPMIWSGGAAVQGAVWNGEHGKLPGPFRGSHGKESNMRKSSRFWWLHGAVLLSAVIGCKNCNSGGSSCAPGGM